jgi:2'-deoxynucleoside 5'-phosphate N-hydrolase
MTAYISVSFSKRKLIDEELSAIINTLHQHKIEPFIFVDNYEFDLTQEREMMQQAMAGIDSCDILIAEVSDKAIGIGIEVGYAKAKSKPVIYLRKKEAERSTTVSGISDVQIVYNDVNDLQKQLVGALKEIIKTLN